MIVERGNPHDPQATALLHQSHAMMREMFEPEENYFLDIDELCAPDIIFLVAKDGNITHGTAALATKTGYGEIKSMFVDPNKRGAGIADALIDALITEAKAHNLTLLRLETSHILKAAVKLYTRNGFTPCPLFGDYTPNDTSLFMEKPL
jgi:putative acetyltransferase